MSKYFFVLGRNPTLSIAEIISIFKKLTTDYSFLNISNEITVVIVKSLLDMSSVIKTLGGTVKIGEIISEIKFDEKEEEFEEIFSGENLIENFLPKQEGKLHIGISIYNYGGNPQYVAQLTGQLKALNILVKENLRKKGLKVGFVRVKDQYLSSVSVAKNQLINKGVEIVLILTNKGIMVGKTLAVQEFDSFSFRDYGRPQKDKRSGIMPPKLARMMINLAQVNSSATILDPFCGSGTILQEAIILEYKDIAGSDISSKAISETQRNLDWLFQNFREVKRSSYNIKIFPTDVHFITKYFQQNSIDAIITEPYLGPPLYKKPDASKIEKTLSEVSRLYLEAFWQFTKILKSQGRIVIIFPAFEEKRKLYFVEILDKIKALGFAQKDFFPEEIKKYHALQLTSRNTILYGSQEQFVKREILSFQKAK